MQYRRIIVDRVVLEESAKEELNVLIEKGFLYAGDTYFGEPVFERTSITTTPIEQEIYKK